MLRAISVETGLDDIKSHLNNCGYEVFDMAECFRPIEAVVYTGEIIAAERTNLVRMAKNTVIVNALGMNGEQVVTLLEAKLN